MLDRLEQTVLTQGEVLGSQYDALMRIMETLGIPPVSEKGVEGTANVTPRLQELNNRMGANIYATERNSSMINAIYNALTADPNNQTAIGASSGSIRGDGNYPTQAGL